MNNTIISSIPSKLADRALELSVVGSFSRFGYEVRHHVEKWSPPERLDGKTMIVTGASSGIGEATAIDLAALGAHVWLIGRNVDRLRAVTTAAQAARGGGTIHSAAVDLTNSSQVSTFVERFSAQSTQLHALVHNAGALFHSYGTVDGGKGIATERTLATHVLAPFHLTWLLAPLLRNASASVIVTVTSGGMYTQRFDPEHIDIDATDYRGSVAYAKAKRDQVVLSHEWARRFTDAGMASYAVHPGWVNTPGLTTGLPRFAKLKPLLRTASQGADTVVWLAADEARRTIASAPTEGLWHDRHLRGEYYVPTTHRSPSENERDGGKLWEWCLERTGLDQNS